MKPKITITLELSVKEGNRLNYLNFAYAQAIEEAGGIPLYFPPLPLPEILEEAVRLSDGLVLTGGADIHPSYYGEDISAPIGLSPNQRTEFDLQFFHAVLEAGKPILAICHGMQIVNVAFGGSLYQDLATQLPGSLAHRHGEGQPASRHRVKVGPESRLAELLQGVLEFDVTSTHHQAVKALGKNLRVSARSPDGVVEGIELLANPNIIGVQWHPEKDPGSEASRILFKKFVEMSGN
jgi:putative glutamine amidotransferase